MNLIINKEIKQNATVKDVCSYPLDIYLFGKCPSCGTEVNSQTAKQYCGNCGCKLLWPDLRD